MIEPTEVIDIMAMAEEARLTSFEIIDGIELAARLKVRPTWIRKHTGSSNPIPHVKLGRYVRFLWSSPDLDKWLSGQYRR
jgi:hypothetical protein